MWIDGVILFDGLLMRKSFLGWQGGNLVITMAKKSEAGLAHALTNYSQRIFSMSTLEHPVGWWCHVIRGAESIYCVYCIFIVMLAPALVPVNRWHQPWCQCWHQ